MIFTDVLVLFSWMYDQRYCSYWYTVFTAVIGALSIVQQSNYLMSGLPEKTNRNFLNTLFHFNVAPNLLPALLDLLPVTDHVVLVLQSL